MTALIPGEDLLASATTDDESHVASLLQQHTSAVEAVCFRRLRSRVDAEDAVQETLLRGLRSLDQVQDPTRVRSYLCRIAERVCLDMIRQGVRAAPQEIADDVCDRATPEERVLATERDALVRQTLKALSTRQAEALWMRDALERPVPEVAEHLGVTEGSARVLLTRARAKMREGWQKVAALIPFTSNGLPAFVGKAGVAVPLVAVAVPATVIIFSVAVNEPRVDVDTIAPSSLTTGQQVTPEVVGIEAIVQPQGVIEDASSTTTTPAPSTTSATTTGAAPDPAPAQVIVDGPGDLNVERETDHDDADDDIDLYDDDFGGAGIDFDEQEEKLLDGVGLDTTTFDPVDPDNYDGDPES